MSKNRFVNKVEISYGAQIHSSGRVPGAFFITAMSEICYLFSTKPLPEIMTWSVFSAKRTHKRGLN